MNVHTLFLGWALGVLTSIGLALLMLWDLERELKKLKDPPTKDEWKVM